MNKYESPWHIDVANFIARTEKRLKALEAMDLPPKPVEDIWHYMPLPGVAACGADYAHMMKTDNKGIVTCPECKAWLESTPDPITNDESDPSVHLLYSSEKDHAREVAERMIRFTSSGSDQCFDFGNQEMIVLQSEDRTALVPILRKELAALIESERAEANGIARKWIARYDAVEKEDRDKYATISAAWNAIGNPEEGENLSEAIKMAISEICKRHAEEIRKARQAASDAEHRLAIVQKELEAIRKRHARDMEKIQADPMASAGKYPPKLAWSEEATGGVQSYESGSYQIFHDPKFSSWYCGKLVGRSESLDGAKALCEQHHAQYREIPIEPTKGHNLIREIPATEWK